MEGKIGQKPPETKVSGQQQGGVGGSSSNYAAALKKGTEPYTRMNLTFIPSCKGEGKPTVELTSAVILAGAEKWKNTIIGHVLGHNPSFQEMVRYVANQWREAGPIKVHKLENGLFIFQLNDSGALNSILERGPWSFSRKPLILREWVVGMPLEKPEVEYLPVWVQFPNLPLDLWTNEALSLIASQIGKPLYADKTTSEQTRLGYARICVEICVSAELPEEIVLKYSTDKSIVQKVRYEWIPMVCKRCKKFGHLEGGCEQKEKDVKGKQKELREGNSGVESSEMNESSSHTAGGSGVKSPGMEVAEFQPQIGVKVAEVQAASEVRAGEAQSKASVLVVVDPVALAVDSEGFTEVKRKKTTTLSPISEQLSSGKTDSNSGRSTYAEVIAIPGSGITKEQRNAGKNQGRGGKNHSARKHR